MPDIATATPDLAGRAAASAIWETRAGPEGLAVSRRPQGDRPPLHRHRLRLPAARRRRGAGHARCSWPARSARLLTPDQYNQLFTMHGMTMIFLYAAPILSGFSNYLWPLMLGIARHGLSPAQRPLLLDLPGRGPVHLRRLRRRRGPERRLVQLCPLCEQGVQPGRQHGLLCAGDDPPRHLDDGRRGQLRGHLPAHRGRPACRSTGCRS